MGDLRATTLSIKQLSGAVSKAIAAEKDRHLLEDGFSINFNLIMGRWLREEIALKDAEALASRITSAVQQAHGAAGGIAAGAAAQSPLQPIVVALRGRVICGFLPDSRVIFSE